MNVSKILTESYSPYVLGSRTVYPIIKVRLVTNGQSISVRALLDTGSNGGISMTINEVFALGITLGTPINPEPVTVELADNSTTEEFEYEAEVIFEGLSNPIPTILGVMGKTPTYMPMTEMEFRQAASKVVVILGREIMDRYIVTFDGKAIPQKKFTFAD
jgi:predicted aspartyl protease